MDYSSAFFKNSTSFQSDINRFHRRMNNSLGFLHCIQWLRSASLN